MGWRLDVGAGSLDPVGGGSFSHPHPHTAPSFLPAGDSWCPASCFCLSQIARVLCILGCWVCLESPPTPSCLGSTLPFAPCSPHTLLSSPVLLHTYHRSAFSQLAGRAYSPRASDSPFSPETLSEHLWKAYTRRWGQAQVYSLGIIFCVFPFLYPSRYPILYPCLLP